VSSAFLDAAGVRIGCGFPARTPGPGVALIDDPSSVACWNGSGGIPGYREFVERATGDSVRADGYAKSLTVFALGQLADMSA